MRNIPVRLNHRLLASWLSKAPIFFSYATNGAKVSFLGWNGSQYGLLYHIKCMDDLNYGLLVQVRHEIKVRSWKCRISSHLKHIPNYCNNSLQHPGKLRESEAKIFNIIIVIILNIFDQKFDSRTFQWFELQSIFYTYSWSA